LNDKAKFWSEKAQMLTWFSPFTNVFNGSFQYGDISWFQDGKLNVCYNCIDRHLSERSEETAIIWESDEPTISRKVTFAELFRETCRIANVMKAQGVRKGDVVTIYMPMIPELAMTMLACTRIGAIHSIVFAGFSAESLKGRIIDCGSKFIFTADEGLRGGKVITLKTVVDEVIIS
jgi:acetyl-CoA synthetase